ncbi:molybdopterin synthase catalytic subunit MoaE [uncultured Microbulbifer sp.]|uniref:molybdopterin synthase catalytic subunit MoaE n=1 Tax=uncultured Microbulbifer sp. TaxID=348147 RepID=UPI0025DCC47B|nr:molybdopterin synthase catalytic subunit MoaE [uncultured Microbulbifer sp.]
MDFIEVRTESFAVAEEFAALRAHNRSDGACAMFVGSVRDFNAGAGVSGLALEHYPGMTQKNLQRIVADARSRWELGRVRLLHRVGPMAVEEDIVFVGVTSSHRQSAFAACHYIMDRLKTEAPFWKLESGDAGDTWVAARDSDRQALEKWQ